NEGGPWSLEPTQVQRQYDALATDNQALKAAQPLYVGVAMLLSAFFLFALLKSSVSVPIRLTRALTLLSSEASLPPLTCARPLTQGYQHVLQGTPLIGAWGCFGMRAAPDSWSRRSQHTCAVGRDGGAP